MTVVGRKGLQSGQGAQIKPTLAQISLTGSVRGLRYYFYMAMISRFFSDYLSEKPLTVNSNANRALK